MVSSQRPSRRMGRRSQSQGVIPCRIQPRSVIMSIRDHAFGHPPTDDTLKTCAGVHASHPRSGPVPGRGGKNAAAVLIARDDPPGTYAAGTTQADRRAWPGTAVTRLSADRAGPRPRLRPRLRQQAEPGPPARCPGRRASRREPGERLRRGGLPVRGLQVHRPLHVRRTGPRVQPRRLQRGVPHQLGHRHDVHAAAGQLGAERVRRT